MCYDAVESGRFLQTFPKSALFVVRVKFNTVAKFVYRHVTNSQHSYSSEYEVGALTPYLWLIILVVLLTIIFPTPVGTEQAKILHTSAPSYPRSLCTYLQLSLALCQSVRSLALHTTKLSPTACPRFIYRSS